MSAPAKCSSGRRRPATPTSPLVDAATDDVLGALARRGLYVARH
jgi:hypothetical protein